MRKKDIKDRRPSKCEYGEEWKNSVGLNKSHIKKYQTMVGEERALIDTIRKRQRKWIGHRLRGVLLLKRQSNEKWMERKQETIYCLCYFTIIFTLFHFTHQLALIYITLLIKKFRGWSPWHKWHNG